MICDRVTKAYDRMDQDYNFAGYPSCFFDGGDEVVVCGPPNANPMRAAIQNCGTRSVTPLDMIVATDWLSNYRIKVRVKIGNGVSANNPPAAPSTPAGQTLFPPNVVQSFSTTVSDPDTDSVLVEWDYGDGATSGWIGPYSSGQLVSTSHSFANAGQYNIRVRVNDRYGEVTDWSPALTVDAACCIGMTGNTNGDPGGAVDLSDLIFLVNYLFLGGVTPICPPSANVNGDLGCSVDLSDLIYLVNYLFLGGPAPAECIAGCE